MVRSVVDGGLSRTAAARRFNTTAKTVAKWVERFRKDGVEGLRDRSSRPHSSPNQTSLATRASVEALRRQRYTGKQIAIELGLSAATVSRILRRLGLNKIDALEPCEPVRRYERQRPGEMIHLDIKKLGRIDGIGHRITGDRTRQSNLRSRGKGPGWEFVHVAIDDASRVAFAKVMNSERRRRATAFLKAALAYYESLGIKVERVMTDNGSCYKSFAFRRPASGSASGTFAPGPTPQKPMARPSALSKLLCASGHMPRPTSIRIRERMICQSGYTATIGTDLMPASVKERPSVGSV